MGHDQEESRPERETRTPRVQVRGTLNVIEDREHMVAGRKAVGRDVAITPGKVILRNRLIELIQYKPNWLPF